MSCSMRTIVISGGSSSMVSNSCALSPEGTPAAGSSRSSTVGLLARASAISTIRCLPYGSWRVTQSASSSSASDSSRRCASRSAARRDETGRSQSPHSPRCSQTASATDSSTVRPGNSVFTWNVRERPRFTRACGGMCVMRSPASITSPASGRSTPVSRLMSVVLPAPFGPISAWRAPACDLQRHVVDGDEAPEAAPQLLRPQRAGHRPTLRAIRRCSRSSPPISPPGATSTRTTSTAPSQNCQYAGLIPASTSCATMKTAAPSSAP